MVVLPRAARVASSRSFCTTPVGLVMVSEVAVALAVATVWKAGAASAAGQGIAQPSTRRNIAYRSVHRAAFELLFVRITALPPLNPPSAKLCLCWP